MKTKAYTCAILSAGLILSFVLAPCLVAQEGQEKKQSEAVYIPKEVNEAFQAGMDNREARLDIPFTVFKHLYLPARENMHVVFFFKVKNSDLGFAPLTPVGGTPEKTEGETAETAQETATPQLQSKAHCFKKQQHRSYNLKPIAFFSSINWMEILKRRSISPSSFKRMDPPTIPRRREFTRRAIPCLQESTCSPWRSLHSNWKRSVRSTSNLPSRIPRHSQTL
jgi:hypothetical protein